MSGALYDPDKVSAYVGEIVDKAEADGLNLLELYGAARSVMATAAAAMAGKADAGEIGRIIEAAFDVPPIG